MRNSFFSVYRRQSGQWFIVSGLVLATITLIIGLVLPVITLKELVFWKHTFSVLGGIASLWTEKHYFLSVVIVLFSVVFPLLKLTALYFLWFGTMASDRSRTYLHWLTAFGKWSMLDVFVVAVTIVVAKISHFASARAEVGIYFFAFSIALTMILTSRIEKMMKGVPSE